MFVFGLYIWILDILWDWVNGGLCLDVCCLGFG